MESIPHNNQDESPPVQAEVVNEGRQKLPSRLPKPRRRLWPVLLVLGLCGSLFINFAFLGVGLSKLTSIDADSRVRERHFSHSESAEAKIAILSIEGTILSGEGFIKRQIDRARKDKNVKALVLRVNSPGGTVSGSDYILHHLRALTEAREIPIVVSMGGLAASGGYYVSMAVGDTPNSIFAEPSTWTGSIGVIIPHYDLSEMLGRWGVEQDSITSDRFKGMGSFAKQMTKEERDLFQALVDDSFSQFKENIKKGRPKFREDTAALNAMATGQIFTARQALAGGLVDRIGFVEDAIPLC